MTIEPTTDAVLIGSLSGIGALEAHSRVLRGHQPWLARIGGEPVGWGWSATREVTIGELGITRVVPAGNRYLWDFVTVPSWRGSRIYPHVLQAIATRDTNAARFWIGHDLANVASARGIARAGFGEVGVLFRRPHGGYDLVPAGSLSRAAAASALFGVPMLGRLAGGEVTSRRSYPDHGRAESVR